MKEKLQINTPRNIFSHAALLMFVSCSFFFFERRRERHAKTIDIAQEEVLTCLGIHLYERLHRIWQKLRAEEQTWQILFHLGIDALRKSFEVSGIHLDSYELDGRR